MISDWSLRRRYGKARTPEPGLADTRQLCPSRTHTYAPRHGQSARAEQNGKKKEFLRALADERAELSFLLKQDDDDADLRRYSAASTRLLAEFLELVSRGKPS